MSEKEARCPICGRKMELVEAKQISAKYKCSVHGHFIVGFLEHIQEDPGKKNDGR
ncbi:hypothetical protein ES703_98435 [subsurface metagenome]